MARPGSSMAVHAHLAPRAERWCSPSRTSSVSSTCWAERRTTAASPGSGSRTTRAARGAHVEPARARTAPRGTPASPARRWLAPYPDYKLPTVIFHDGPSTSPTSRRWSTSSSSSPVGFLDHLPRPARRRRAAHGVLRPRRPRPGRGQLVPRRGRPGHGAPAAWSPTTSWRGSPAATAGPPGVATGSSRPTVAWSCGEPGGAAPSGWLSHDPGEDRPFEAGRTLGQDVTAPARPRPRRVRAVLRRWWGGAGRPRRVARR